MFRAEAMYGTGCIPDMMRSRLTAITTGDAILVDVDTRAGAVYRYKMLCFAVAQLPFKTPPLNKKHPSGR
jgi:hypothetical protein